MDLTNWCFVGVCVLGGAFPGAFLDVSRWCEQSRTDFMAWFQHAAESTGSERASTQEVES